jgi:25S rRNA (cytosine2278-C5)-methyltransferase
MSRQYLNASKAIGAVKSGTPLKKYCSKVKIGKEEYALACETLKYGDVLDRICNSVSVTAKTLDVDENLLQVMLYEILFGKGKIKSGGVVKRRIMENADKLMAGLSTEMKAKGTQNKFELLSDDMLVSENIPKYIRINSIKSSVSSGVAELSIFTGTPLSVDIHIPSLVMIPAKKAIGLNRSDGVSTGRLIMQDKASCFPSQILHDEWAEIKSRTKLPVDMVDACAAPGNKTSHLSASSFQADPAADNAMHLTSSDCRKGKFLADVFAFDKSVERAQLLKDRMAAAGATNVHVCNADFLEVNVADPKYKNVRALLVDPSCSGSGVVRSLERALERTMSAAAASGGQADLSSSSNSQQDDRLIKLSQFQVSVVTKAMSFPAAEAVVYSTCSVHVVSSQVCS